MKIDRVETVEGRELVKIAVAYAEKQGAPTVELPVSALRELLDASPAEVETVVRDLRKISGTSGWSKQDRPNALADRLDATRKGERDG